MKASETKKAYRLIKKKCIELDLRQCEFPSCNKLDTLTIAHRKSRRFYRTAEDLADRNDWIVCCMEHHHYLDHTAEGIRKKEEIFNIIKCYNQPCHN
jgi:hypothetical protein